MDVTARLAALRTRLLEEGIEAFIARSVPNVTYLSGFDGVWDDEPSSLILVTHFATTVVTDSRFREASQSAAHGGPADVFVAPADAWVAVSGLLAGYGLTRVAVEASLPWRVIEHARAVIEGEVIPVDDWVELLRMTKDAEEVRRMCDAQALTDAAFDHILGFVCEGMTEAEIALELEFHMRSQGSEGVAFAPIVASGPNSALPHAKPGPRRVQRGDLLKMDFGARVGGYCADMTRTVVMGPATGQQRDMYAAVLSANLAGIAAVAGGRVGSEIDAAAREVIEAAGYGERFGHGLGHGVGLEIHEAPSVGPRGTRPVPVGSAITIEPGIYIPGLGGVRIEDLIVVESAGARVLTRSSKELIEL